MSDGKKTKVCGTCRDRKPLTEFYKSPNKSYKDGRVPKCKLCVLEYDRQRAEKHKGPKTSGTKICTCCRKERHVKYFNKRLRARDGLRSRCKTCEQKAEHAYRKADPTKERVRRIWHVHGLKPEEYQKMLTEQKHKCKICKEYKKLVVDHDHTTLKIRGLLCTGCNLGLGAFEDDTSKLENAIRYLQESQKNKPKGRYKK